MKSLGIAICVACMVGLLGSTASAGLADGLVLYYPFDVDGGAAVTDQSGYGNNGANGGASFTTNGRIGGAYYFDGGSNELITIPASASLNVKDTFTISAYFNAYSYVGVLRPILYWLRTSPTVKSGVHFVTGDTGYQWSGKGTGAHLCGTDGAENILSRVVNTADPIPNQWHHLVVTFNRTGGVAQVYVDGVLGETQTFTPFEPQTTFNLYVGGIPVDPRIKFYGLLDEIRIYSRVLSYDEILELGEGSGGGGGTDGPCISFIGFSNDPEGDQDVTEFYQDETLYIRVRDVDVTSPSESEALARISPKGKGTLILPVKRAEEDSGPKRGVLVWLQQKGKGTVMLPMTLNEDGSYTGQTPLNIFNTGTLSVRINTLGSSALTKKTDITIRAPTP